MNVNRIFKHLFTLVFVLLVAVCNATNYYVSVSGNDTNSGTSESQPWKSLSKVSSFNFSPGDQILFKRGDSWSGTITVTSSGASGSPIVYGAYGTGENPKIYGSEEITGWTKYSGNIYKAIFGKTVTQLFVDDSKMKVARHPNSGYLFINSVNSSTSFTSNALDGGIDYSGATWLGRTSEYFTPTAIVTSSSSTTLKISTAPAGDLGANEGFVLMNKLNFIDQAGEWCYESSSNTVYLWMPNGDSPANYSVRGSVYKNGFYLSNKDNVKIESLNILQHSETGIYTSSSDQLIINNNTISNAERFGIYDNSNSTGNTISNNKVTGSNEFGLYLRTSNSVIKDNEILESALFNNLGILGTGDHAAGGGIFIGGINGGNTISYNRIIDTGYHGIYFARPNNLVQYNFIQNACLLKGDGGGIYTSFRTTPGPNGSRVKNNIVLNVTGSKYGFTSSRAFGEGIYIDESAEEVIVENNTVARCSNSGIFLHDNARTEVKNNTILDGRYGILVNKEHGANLVSDNIVYALNNDDYEPNKLLVKRNSLNTTFQNNKYINHYNSSSVFKEGGSYYNFEGWKSSTKQDANSTLDISSLAAGEKEVLMYNDSKQVKNINLGNTVYRDIDGNKVSGSLTLQPFTSKILIQTTATESGSNKNPVIENQFFGIWGDQQINDFIGQVLASDPDIDQKLTYAIEGGNTEGLFYIDGTTGAVYANAIISETSDKSIELLVSVTDNAVSPLSASALITINITAQTVNNTPDATPPSITTFILPSNSQSLTVPVTKLIAEDNVMVSGYLLSTSSQIPSVDNSGWMTTVPSSFVFDQVGTYTVYAWAKDANNNISASTSASVTISIVEVDLSSTYSEYLFEEGVGATVLDTRGENDGVIMNEENRVTGIRGKGVKFAGSGYINLGQCFGDNVINAVTVSAWIKPDNTVGDFQGVVMHGGPVDDSFALYIKPGTNTVAFKTSATSSSWITIDNVDALWDGNWHHVAVTYNGVEKVIYLDNIELTRVFASGAIESGKGYNLLIGAGRDQVTPTLLYKGAIDEVRIYNYGLTSSEVAELYNVTNSKTETVYTREDISICEGGTYQGWTSAGEYQRVLQTSTGGDSIVTTYLHVNLGYNITENVQIKEGENYLGWTTAGQYTRTLETVSGCDSIVTTILEVQQTPAFDTVFTREDISICEGGSYQGWTSAGEYQRALQTSTGGDSIVTTYLYVNSVYSITENIHIQVGENYLGWTTAGQYTRTLETVSGCDSIVTTILEIQQIPAFDTVFTREDISICEGGSYQGWTSAGEYQRALQTSTGGDSIVTTYLYVNSVYSITENIHIQVGENYLGWTTAGQYTRTLETVSGCDSIVTTILEIQQIPAFDTVYTREDISICEGGSYHGWTSAGEYQRVLLTSAGGDSIVTTYLHINPVYYIAENIQIKEGENYLGWTTSGSYTRTLESVSGCDSIVTTILEVQQILDSRHFQTVWENENGQNHMNFCITSAHIEDVHLGKGDEIAIFDNDICVGRVVLSSTINPAVDSTYAFISVSQNDGNTNGFTDGDEISFRVWDASDQIEKNINQVKYSSDLSEWISTGKFVGGGTSVVEIGYIFIEPDITQAIQLERGWNIFSALVVPEETDMTLINDSLINDNLLVKLQDEAGNTLERIRKDWVNNIGNLMKTEGYRIRVKSATTLHITGKQVSLPMNINVKIGSNLISFPYNGSVDALQVVQPLIDAGILGKVQDEKGNSIENWGSTIGWINGIGNFEAGEGYLVQVSRDGILPINNQYEKSATTGNSNIETVYFLPNFEGNGKEHMNINLIGLKDADFQIGDEIAAFDGEICVGAIKLTSANLRQNAASISASASDADQVNGFIENNNIELKYWRADTDCKSDLSLSVIDGNLIYNKYGSVFAMLNKQITSINNNELNTLGIELYPNPAVNNVTISFTDLPEVESRIILMDINGKQLQSRAVQSTRETIDLQSYPTGIYLVKTIVGNASKVNKLIKN